jgi:hypothetical protein
MVKFFHNERVFIRAGIIGTIYDITMQLNCYKMNFFMTEQCNDYIYRYDDNTRPDENTLHCGTYLLTTHVWGHSTGSRPVQDN